MSFVIPGINGKKGVEKATDIIPDIIISDVMMPFMDGFQVCNFLKSDDKTSHIPIILLTAKADLKSKIEGITHGADAYLGKPFNKIELLAHLDNLIKLREKLKTKYSQEINEVNTSKTKLTDSFLNKLQSLLLLKIDNESYGIHEICLDLAISRTQLHRKIKAITGLSSSIFIREIRLKEGYKLLLIGNLTVSEVAYSVGFSDPNYFTKLFTQKYGKTPSSIE
ncbi:response regulator transcription factor [Psychroserpens sp. MEBiC05023]